MSSDLRSEASSGTLSKSKSGAKTSVDVSEGTKRRNDQTVSLRKKTRLEQLSKKRKEDSDNENDNSEAYIAETTAMFERLGDYVNMMDKSNPIEVVGEGVAAIRRMLCHPDRNPMRELIQLGGLDKLISCLDAPDPAIQFNAAWSLTNISSFAQSNAQLIISLGAIPRFINFLQHPVEKLREQAAWCLGNMAGDGAQVRDEILNAGVMSPLLECLNGENENIATMRNACWLLAQLVRNKPSPAFETVECCLPTLRNLLEHPVSEIQDDACWAVSYISDGPPSRINAVMSYGVMPIIYDLLKSGRETVLLPSVRTFGNFTATNPEMTQIVIDQGVLNFLPPLLHPKVSRQIRKEVCWLISNACAGYDSQVEAVINADLFPPVVNNMYASEFEVRREAVWVVANATATASVERIRFLVEACDVLGGLCNVLATMDSRICNIALESIEAILLVGDQFRGSNDGRNPYADHIESIGGRDNIGRLRDHICHTVFLRSATIMDRYFDDGWNADDFGPSDGNNNDNDDDDNNGDNNDDDGDNNNNNGNTNNQPQQQGNRSGNNNNNNNNGNDRISF